jgi:hypothetical protein
LPCLFPLLICLHVLCICCIALLLLLLGCSLLLPLLLLGRRQQGLRLPHSHLLLLLLGSVWLLT